MSSNISETISIRKYDKIYEYQWNWIKQIILQFYIKWESVFYFNWCSKINSR